MNALKEHALRVPNQYEYNTQSVEQSIDEITSRTLTADNINDYADTALTDFIRVVEQTIAQYRRHPTIHFADGLDEERAALRYANLDLNVIEQTLDHIADVADRLRQLDTEIAKATNYDTHVYVPPSPTETMITNGDGSFEPKKQIPRIKKFVTSSNKSMELILATQTKRWSYEAKLNHR